VADIDWNVKSKWSILSCSDDTHPFNLINGANEKSLQVYRPLDLLTMDESEAVDALCQENYPG